MTPAEGEIEEEVATIMVEIKMGIFPVWQLMKSICKKQKVSRNGGAPTVCRNSPTCTDETGTR